MSIVYRQGPLVVEREGDAYRIVDDGGQALVSGNGDIRLEGDDEVVGVVATALSARIRGEAFHVHAGGVRVTDGVILVAGDSGAGKTTASLALAGPGGLMGDDVCFIRLEGDRVMARASVRPLHVGDVTRAMFPGLDLLDERVTRAGKRRARLPYGRDRSEWSAVVGLVFPGIDRRVGATSTASPLATSTALRRLLQASAMVTWPHVPHAQAHLDVLGRLARVPAYALRMGGDAQTDPSVVVEVLRSVGFNGR